MRQAITATRYSNLEEEREGNEFVQILHHKIETCPQVTYSYAY